MSRSPSGLRERLLALHHPGAGAVSELLDELRVDLRHRRQLSCVGSASEAGAASGTIGSGSGAAAASAAGAGSGGRERARASGRVPARGLRLGFGLDLGAGGARHDGFATLLPSLGQRVRDQTGDQRDRPDRVVVARDHEVHLVGIAVRVHDRDHRDAELARLVDRDVLLLRVDHEDRVGEPFEALHAAEVALELLLLVPQADRLALGEEVERARALHLAQLAQAEQSTRDRLEVREHPAEPAGRDERHPDANGVVGDDLLGLLLGPDEQDHAAAMTEIPRVRVGLLEARQGLLEVDDVDPGAFPVQVPAHLRVPTSCLVPEVHPCLEELPPGHDRHGALLPVVPPPGSARPRPGRNRDPVGDPRACELGVETPANAQSTSGVGAIRSRARFSAARWGAGRAGVAGPGAVGPAVPGRRARRRSTGRRARP